MKVNRRELAAIAMGAAVATSVEAQGGPGDDAARAIRDANKANEEALSKIELPLTTEPAFLFQA